MGQNIKCDKVDLNLFNKIALFITYEILNLKNFNLTYVNLVQNSSA